VAIKGSLKEASLPDVLQLLSLGQKTGCLSITDQSSLGYIYFDSGRICYATVVNRRDRLGDILVKSGKISQIQLDEAIRRQGNDRDKRVGELLVEIGALPRAELEQFMRLQIEDAVYFLFTWRRGNFTFESDIRPHKQDFLVSIDPEGLLLEGARRVDEWSLIEKKIPSFDLLFRLDKERLDGADVRLTAEQERIIPLLDGSRDVRTIMEETGLMEFDVGKALYGLIMAGFVHRAGRSEGGEKPEPRSARVDEHRNLGIAFYKTGMLDEAVREFRRVVALRPSDGSAFFHLGLIHFKQAQWKQAIESFRAASDLGGAPPTVLHNLALSHELAGNLDKAESLLADAAERGGHDARILTSWGLLALRRGDHEEAGARLDRARDVAAGRNLDAVWFWARSLAAAATDCFDEAVDVLREGLESYPENAVLCNNLAALLDLLGNHQEAEELLRVALAEEPSMPQLSKNLGDLHYRSGNYDDAWDAYQRVVNLQPSLGDDVYFKLGNIAYKKLRRDDATKYWKRAVELNPKHELARTNLETMNALD
jgi:tetratricopeptide (TPR) repeat protein